MGDEFSRDAIIFGIYVITLAVSNGIFFVAGRRYESDIKDRRRNRDE